MFGICHVSPDGARAVFIAAEGRCLMVPLDPPGAVQIVPGAYRRRCWTGVEVHDFLELQGGSSVMVMELLSSESLADRIERELRLPLRETASILLAVISAVGRAHALGIVHRDLKPENIFLVDCSGARVKVLDFGIAKRTALEGEAAGSTDLTRSGTTLGTPCYMAPEQAFGEREIDHRADIWALDLILYQCLSGVLPTRRAGRCRRARTADRTHLRGAHAPVAIQAPPVRAQPDHLGEGARARRAQHRGDGRPDPR